MQQDELECLQKTLVSALGVRHHVTGLLGLAHEITLVSLNAKITSSQIGDAGRVFSVMTNEITAISTHLHKTVNDIRQVTHDWTQIIAKASGQMRRLQSLSEARARGAAKGHSLERIDGAFYQATDFLKEFSGSHPKLLAELLRIINGMERSLKVVNYVKIGIMIESARLTGIDGTEHNPFQHLADEMQSAAEKIRAIATRTTQQLQGLTSESSNRQSFNSGGNYAVADHLSG